MGFRVNHALFSYSFSFSDEANMGAFRNIPHEITAHTLDFTPIEDQCRLSLVSHTFAILTAENRRKARDHENEILFKDFMHNLSYEPHYTIKENSSKIHSIFLDKLDHSTTFIKKLRWYMPLDEFAYHGNISNFYEKF